MNDFTPEFRNAAWWSSDSRRAVNGGLIDVIREKRGEQKPKFIEDREPLEMGLTMQPHIGQIWSDVTGIRASEMDEIATHSTELWLKTHTDFMTADGGLLETKNYNANAITKFSEPDEPVRVPIADYTQCLHEATVFDVPHVYLGVLFGGQRFRYYKFEFSREQKDEFVKQAAAWWGYVQGGNLPEPETPDQARAVWPYNTENTIIASQAIEGACQQLKAIKAQIKLLEKDEEAITVALQKYLKDAAGLVSVDGRMLATWKNSKPTKKLDVDAFKASLPQVYESFLKEAPGSRRFLVK